MLGYTPHPSLCDTFPRAANIVAIACMVGEGLKNVCIGRDVGTPSPTVRAIHEPSLAKFAVAVKMLLGEGGAERRMRGITKSDLLLSKPL